MSAESPSFGKKSCASMVRADFAPCARTPTPRPLNRSAAASRTRTRLILMSKPPPNLFRSTLVAPANLRVPVAHPGVGLPAQQLPVHLHPRERLAHPGRELRAVHVRARGDAVILARGVQEALRRRDKLVEAARLFLVRRAAHDGYPVRDDERAALGDDVAQLQVLLFAEDHHVRHSPEADRALAPRQL